MTTYSNPTTVTYSFAAINQGSTVTRAIGSPANKRGRVVDIISSVTTTFTDTTTEGFVRVGVTGTLDKYAELPMADTAAGAARVASNVATAKLNEPIPAGEALLVTFTAPTGGSPAGVADHQIVVEWYD